jgi:hypothetical protein
MIKITVGQWFISGKKIDNFHQESINRFAMPPRFYRL